MNIHAHVCVLYANVYAHVYMNVYAYMHALVTESVFDFIAIPISFRLPA